MNLNSQIETLVEYLRHAERLVVISGAGISTESGIPDFRSQNGIFRTSRIEDMLSRSYFERDPAGFWEVFRSTFLTPEFLGCRPNVAHERLAEWEAAGIDVTIVTQNVDGLHEKAGSRRVLQIHGSLKTAHCLYCESSYAVDEFSDVSVPRCMHCLMRSCPEDPVLKPDVVLFGDSVRHFSDAFAATALSDVLLMVGTSLTVEPVASLPNIARGRRILINREETEWDDEVDLCLHMGIGDVFSQLPPHLKLLT